MNAFYGAADYDAGRTKPAGKDARFVWNCILDKPHWALPHIQDLVSERDEARKEAAELRQTVENFKKILKEQGYEVKD